jgi:2-methylcitrate dehydratase PrpD
MAMRLHHGGSGVKGGNGFWDYLEVDFRDPRLLESARKVKVRVAANDKWERVDEGAGIEVETVDGRRLTASVPFSKGLPENPMSPAEVEEKFRYLVDPVMPAGSADAIIAAVDGIEKIDEIGDLVRLLIAPPAPGARAAAE